MEMNMVQSINNALSIALEKDENVVLLGEDIGKSGGVFRVTAGLQEKFGESRVMDTPLEEQGIVGAREAPRDFYSHALKKTRGIR
jgi:2-oxoisovalerate dehydrogenase E1 component beta subunit